MFPLCPRIGCLDACSTSYGLFSKTAKLWDASSGALLLTIGGHTAVVTAAVFSPNGKLALTGSCDWTAKVWRIGPELSVTSTPFTGVSIGGDCPGTTNYKVVGYDSPTATLSAPATATSGGVDHGFARWVIDGTEMPAGQLDLQAAMTRDCTALAVYETHTLTVQSAPVSGIAVTGDRPGTTEYGASCYAGQVIDLSVPPTVSSAGVRYNFLRSILDGSQKDQGQVNLQVTMDSDHAAVALYAVQTWTLGVQSIPITDVAITGDCPGSTSYSAVLDDQAVVRLIAPPTVRAGQASFVRWLVDGTEMPAGQLEIQITIATTDVAPDHIYYLDPINGSDTNDGHTPATAVRTWKKLFYITNGLIRYAPVGPVVLYILNDVDTYADGANGVAGRSNGGGLKITSCGWARLYTLPKVVCTADPDTDIITTIAAHGMATGHSMGMITSGTAPGGITVDAAYFARVIDPTTFYVYDTYDHAVAGGAPGLINITDAGTGVHTLKAGACTVSVTADAVEITGMRIEHPLGNGLDCFTSNIHIHDNVFMGDCSAGSSINLGNSGYPVSDCIVENNVIVSSVVGNYGIGLGVTSSDTGRAIRCVVRNNTIINTAVPIKFDYATDCASYGNKIGYRNCTYDVWFTANAIRCHSDGDHLLNGGTPTISNACATCTARNTPTDLDALPDAVPGANGGLPTVDASNRVADIQGTDGNHTAVAVYRIDIPNLTVQSTPVAGAEISGDKPGSTDYTAICTLQQVVNLTAPSSFWEDGRYVFLHWTLDGVDQTVRERNLQVTMETDHTAVAAYAIEMLSVSVRSDPAPGVAITGTSPGTTPFTELLASGTTVSFTAPATASLGGIDYNFVRWMVDSTPIAQGQLTVERIVTTNSDSFTAVYAMAPGTLVVESAPVAGVSISGSRPGTTSYPAKCASQERVTLTAPEAASVDGSTILAFSRWVLDGVAQPLGQATISFTVSAARIAVARYVWVTWVNRNSPSLTEDGSRENPFKTIQAGVVHAPGSLVMIEPGTYQENVSWEGRTLELRGTSPSRCIINGNIDVGMISWMEDDGGVSYGHYIRGSVTTSGVTIAGTTTCSGSSLAAANTVFGGDVTVGAASYLRMVDPMHYAGYDLCAASASIGNCTLPSLSIRGSSVSIENSIFTGGIAVNVAQLDFSGGQAAIGSTLSISHTCLSGGEASVTIVSDWGFDDWAGEVHNTITWDASNIFVDPLLADVAAGDYHLKSRFGRWNHATQVWVTDTVTSTCIDAGDPASSYANEPQPNFGRINMGAYGNTPEASKSGWNIPGDVNGDCKVNILDLLAVRNHLGQSASSGENWKYDANSDGVINILDLILVRNALGTKCK